MHVLLPIFERDLWVSSTTATAMQDAEESQRLAQSIATGMHAAQAWLLDSDEPDAELEAKLQSASLIEQQRLLQVQLPTPMYCRTWL